VLAVWEVRGGVQGVSCSVDMMGSAKVIPGAQRLLHDEMLTAAACSPGQIRGVHSLTTCIMNSTGQAGRTRAWAGDPPPPGMPWLRHLTAVGAEQAHLALMGQTRRTFAARGEEDGKDGDGL
jgi:hypothetical protein